MSSLPSYGYLSLLAAVAVLVFTFIYHQKEAVKKSWPSVQGTITESKIIKTTRAELETPTVNRSMRDDKYYSHVDVWALSVEYHYTLHGKDYVGARATANNWDEAISDHPNSPSQKMVDWSHQLQKGASVPVHYDPDSPSDAYIIYAENPKGKILGIGIGLLILGVALIAAPRIF